jgi:hypothetical protein
VPVFEVKLPLVEMPVVEIAKPVIPTKVFTDDQLQRFMDINVKKNVDLKINDHKETVRRELAKYRATNQQQIDNFFKN